MRPHRLRVVALGVIVMAEAISFVLLIAALVLALWSDIGAWIRGEGYHATWWYWGVWLFLIIYIKVIDRLMLSLTRRRE